MSEKVLVQKLTVKLHGAKAYEEKYGFLSQSNDINKYINIGKGTGHCTKWLNRDETRCREHTSGQCSLTPIDSRNMPHVLHTNLGSATHKH